MTLYKYILTLFLGLFLTATFFAQVPGETWSSNVSLKCKTNFGRGGSADVWGWEAPNGTHYALVVLDGGLSIVNTSNPSSPHWLK